MAKECKKCKAPVTESTKVCPQCGVENPGATLKEALAGLVVLVFIGWVVLSLAGGTGKGSSAGEGGDDGQPVSASISPSAAASVPLGERVAPTRAEARDFVQQLDMALDNELQAIGSGNAARLRDHNVHMDGLLKVSTRWPPDHPCAWAAGSAWTLWQQAKSIAREPSRMSLRDGYVRSFEEFQEGREACLQGVPAE